MKKKIYTVVTIVLCLLLSLYIYEWIMISGIIRADLLFAFSVLWSIVFVCAGIGGYFLSKVRWRIVYIEKRHRRNVFKK